MPSKLTAFTTTLFLVVFASSPAGAEQRDPAAAQALFDQGLALMDRGKHTEACAKLEESQRLDPGIGTLYHLANCREATGQIATAWATFLEVASLARSTGQSEREEAASTRAARLEPRLPKIRLIVPESSRVPGLQVWRNGRPVGSAQWQTPLPVDPGMQRIEMRAVGRKTVVRTVEVDEGETVGFAVPLLAESTDGEDEATENEAAKRPADSQESEPAGEKADDTSSTRLWAYGLGAAGIVGIGVGTAFALMARSDNEESKLHCRPDDPNRCRPEGIALRDSAIARGNVATVAFSLGGAALAGAGVLWFLGAPSGKSQGASVQAGAELGPAAASLLVKGRF